MSKKSKNKTLVSEIIRAARDRTQTILAEHPGTTIKDVTSEEMSCLVFGYFLHGISSTIYGEYVSWRLGNKGAPLSAFTTLHSGSDREVLA